MKLKNRLIIVYIIFSFLFGEGISFRGKTKDQLIGQSIPLSFSNMVSNNYNILPSQINPQRGSFMIIAPDGIITYLGDFVEFKKSQGFDVYVLSLSESGTSADEIKVTISNKLAEDPMLEYIMLIGDVDGFAAFPSFYYGPENDVTDQKFTYLLGNDNIPDVYIGRLSIDSLSDLAVILSKTMKYARDPLAYNSDWLDRGLIVAGNYSNTYPIPITPKWTSYWLRDELLDYGYSQVDTVFYPPTQQGAPYIIPAINNGVGIVNYRGWGDANGWHYPEFHVDDVNDLNNGWLTPVFMSYVCNSNDFANNVDPCLAEAIIRGGTPTVPKGGVAFIGPSDLHTSTKYNNVINAYMYDAMLNHGVVELGPAMQAGQSGLIKEFPAQNGPGEAQEFYAHVYNILGDPSLSIYMDTPELFSIEINEIKRSDNFIDIAISDPNGNPVRNAVISVMGNGDIVAKGITDNNGHFIASPNLSNFSSINIYANKSGFIQGSQTAIIVENDQIVHLSDLIINPADGNSKPSLGSIFTIDIVLNNSSNEVINGSGGVINFSNNVNPSMIDIDIPPLQPGSSTTISDIDLISYGVDVGSSIVGNLSYNTDIERIFDFAIEFEMPVFNIQFENQPEPNSEFQPELYITNLSSGEYADIWIELSVLSDGAETILNNASGPLSSFSSFESSIHVPNYNINIGDVARGSDIAFLVNFKKNDQMIFTQEVPLHILPSNASYPVAPSNYGYWAYDDTDIGFEATPTFNWIELDPNYGGTNGTHHQLDDDDHTTIQLPFNFKYHGIEYSQITINSNGWASFEPCDIDYFWNMSIPMYMGPKALLAPFSDDLETIDSDNDGEIDVWINVYTWYDETNGKFIIEWSRALNGYDEITEETFEIILYDQNSMPTESGDGVIDYQYLEIYDVDVTKNYSTVGIESPNKNYGLQYVFNNVYAPGAAPLENERVIRFTTKAPENYIGPLSIIDNNLPDKFFISPAYPNPFNPITNIDIMIQESEYVQVNIINLLGREVATLYKGNMIPGQYRLSWDGKSHLGSTLSSGTYFVVMKYGDNMKIQKVLLLK